MISESLTRKVFAFAGYDSLLVIFADKVDEVITLHVESVIHSSMFV